jgi:hypothetical protein
MSYPFAAPSELATLAAGILCGEVPQTATPRLAAAAGVALEVVESGRAPEVTSIGEPDPEGLRAAAMVLYVIAVSRVLGAATEAAGRDAA